MAPIIPATPDATRAHARLVQGLVRVLSAAHPAPPPQVLQTHISTLVLAGATAWKLKRPVRLPFLDFSDRAARCHFLLEELRLNRRTAPALYRDVVPLTGDVDAPQVGPPLDATASGITEPDRSGNTLDWALRMVRFDSHDEFHARARAGLLDTDDIDALAAHLASFHANLPPCLVCVPSAALDIPVWAWARSSLDEIAALPGRPAHCSTEQVAQVGARLQQQLTRHQALMAQRSSNGWVRECHGDLHLANIVRWEGQVLAFDALEFDPALRCIDVVCDIAFTFMDLLAHDRPALAWRLISAWCEHLGDRSGLALLRPFAAYRALVRAKVSLLGQDGTAFSRYWAVAETLLAPQAPPTLVLTAGLSGSGKSTVAQLVCEALGAVRVRSDVERKRLLGLQPTQRAAAGSALQQQLYARATTEATYRALAELAGEVLGAGLPVVVDAAALRTAERTALRDLARQHGAVFLLLWCEAPPDQLHERMARRAQAGYDPSDATAALLPLQQRVCEPPDPQHPEAAHNTFVIRNAGSLNDLALQVRTLLAGADFTP